MNKICSEHKIPTVADLMEITLDIFINLAVNYCGCEGRTKQLIVNWVHPLFLKDPAEASKEDNPNWNQAMNGPFANEYWKSTCTKLETLEVMGYLYVVDCKDDSIWSNSRTSHMGT